MARKSPRRSDDDEDRSKQKKKSKKAGMSTGLLIGLLAGGGLVLLFCLVGGGLGVWWMTSKGGKGGGAAGGILGGKSKEESVVLQPGEERAIRMTCDDKKQMIVTVKTKLENPQAKLDAWIPVQDDATKKWSELARGQGTDIRMEFTSPGFGQVEIKLKNHGPGTATSAVSHNGS